MREHRHSRPCRDCDGSLSDLLGRCGHYYAHRIGGKTRGQDSVLLCLSNHPDATQKELGEALGITPASLSEVLMKLERKGHITRTRDEVDRRFTRVRLTAEGEAALGAPQQERDPFSALSPQEQETLKGLLGKLLEDWEIRCESSPRQRHTRDFSRHGGEHPGHGEEHPGHSRTHTRHQEDDHVL